MREPSSLFANYLTGLRDDIQTRLSLTIKHGGESEQINAKSQHVSPLGLLTRFSGLVFAVLLLCGDRRLSTISSRSQALDL